MDAKVNYTVVGVFVIFLSIALIYTIIWLTTGTSNIHYKTYSAYMKESVSGLAQQSPVKYNGVKVGYVANISLNPNDPTQVRLLLDIEDDIPIRENTTATLESQGLTGIAYIGLRGGAPGSPLLMVQAGQEYPVIQTRPSLLLRLDSALRNLTGNLDSITNGIKSILDKDNQMKIKNSLTHIETVTATLASNSSRMTNALKHLNEILTNTNQASKQFPQLITNANKSLIDFQKMSQSIKETSNQLNGAVRKGSVVMENLSNQLSPELYTTLQNVSNLSVKLKQLGSELSQNPAMLIRGKYPSTPGPGESR